MSLELISDLKKVTNTRLIPTRKYLEVMACRQKSSVSPEFKKLKATFQFASYFRKTDSVYLEIMTHQQNCNPLSISKLSHHVDIIPGLENKPNSTYHASMALQASS